MMLILGGLLGIILTLVEPHTTTSDIHMYWPTNMHVVQESSSETDDRSIIKF